MALIDIEALKRKETKLNDITIDMLIEDAIERGSEEGIAFLNKEYHSTVTRKGKSIRTPISSYRKVYLEKYAGYKKKAQYNPETAKKYAARKKAEEEKRVDDLFSAALSKFNNK